MVVSRAAKQSRVRNTTVCYIHEKSILIERSPKAYCKKIPCEKTTCVTKTTYNNFSYKTTTYSPFFFSNTPWNVGQSVVLFFSSSFFAYSLRR